MYLTLRSAIPDLGKEPYLLPIPRFATKTCCYMNM